MTPPSRGKKPRTLIRFWASPEEEARWKATAQEEGHTLSSWLRSAAEDRVKFNVLWKELREKMEPNEEQ